MRPAIEAAIANAIPEGKKGAFVAAWDGHHVTVGIATRIGGKWTLGAGVDWDGSTLGKHVAVTRTW